MLLPIIPHVTTDLTILWAFKSIYIVILFIYCNVFVFILVLDYKKLELNSSKGSDYFLPHCLNKKSNTTLQKYS